MRQTLLLGMHEATKQRQELSQLVRHMDSVVHDAELVRSQLKERLAIVERSEMQALRAVEEYDRQQKQTGANTAKPCAMPAPTVD